MGMIYCSLSFLQGTGDTFPEAEEQRLARAKYVICDDEPEYVSGAQIRLSSITGLLYDVLVTPSSSFLKEKSSQKFASSEQAPR